MKLHRFLPLMALAALLGACSDDKDFHPGPAAPEHSVSPYFPQDATDYFAFTTDDDMQARIPVRRLRADAPASVPVVATGDTDCIRVPRTVDFEQGQLEATLVVDCSAMPMKQECKASITFGADQLNPYVDGLCTLDLTAIVSQWVLYGRDVEVTFDGKPAEPSDIYMLEGSRQFKITNFVGSTFDLPFVLGTEAIDPWDDGNHAYSITPTKNAWPNPSLPDWWYFYDQDGDWWPSWTFDGKTTPAISYLQVYYHPTGEGYEASYMVPYYESTKNPGTFWSYIVLDGYADYEDGSYGYAWIEMNFHPLFRPFED